MSWFFVAVELHARHHLAQLAVGAHGEEPLAPHGLEELLVVTLPGAHQGGEQQHLAPFVALQDEADDLLLGVFHHPFARHVRVGIGCPGVEQSQEVVDFCHRAHRRTRVLVRGFLFNADDGAEARNLVHVGPFQVVQEVTCVGREGFDITPLAFGIERVEGQRAFSRPAQSRDDTQALAWQGDVGVFQVVDPCAENFYVGLFVVCHG